jgi:6-phosphogluconate dehydrogenase
MGRSLAMNFERNGYPVIGCDIAPRVLFLMVPAAATVAAAIASPKPYLHPGDVIIDGGNSYFTDTERRVKELQEAGLHFVRVDVLGGETGALWSLSLLGPGNPGPEVAAMSKLDPTIFFSMINKVTAMYQQVKMVATNL